MLKEREKLVRCGMMALDALVVAGAFCLTYFLRANFHLFYKLDIFPSAQVVGAPVGLSDYLPTLFLWVPIWVMILHANGGYRNFRVHSVLEIIGRVARAGFFSALVFGSLAFMFKLQFVSRVFFVMFVGMTSGMIVLEKLIILAFIRFLRRLGFNYRRLLVVGTGSRAERFIKMVGKFPEWGFKLCGLIDDEREKVGNKLFGTEVIGVLADIPRIIRDNVIDEVIFIVPRMWLDRISESISACELQGVKTSVAADFFNLKIARAKQTDLNGFPLISFETTFGHEWQLFVKRVLDLTIVTMGLLVLLPFLLLTAGLIKLSSRGPVFFRQKRMGMNGRIFTLFKFRTMVAGAEEKLAELKHLNEMDGPVFKIKNDPRITPVGRVLRKLSIDEFPQLFNVFLGHMSLVGPRPPIPREVIKYELWQRRRLSMRPGITCLWQIGGRNKIGFEEWMELDLEYIDNWSLWLDFKILAMTIPVVLFGSGAR